MWLYRGLLSLILIASIIVPFIVPDEVRAVDSYTRLQTITITDNTGADRSNIPLLLPSINGTYLVPLLYINAGGTNTAMTDEDMIDVPFMMDTILTGTYIASIPAYDSVTYSFLMGCSPVQTSFPIIVGNEGYITTTDNSSLEMDSGNISVSYKGAFLDAIQTDENIVNHQDSFRVYYDSADSVTASINGTVSENQSLTDLDYPMFSGGYTRTGQLVDSVPACTINSLSFVLSRSVGVTGTANITVRQASDDALLGIIGTVDVSTLPVNPSYKWITVNSTPIVNPIEQSLRFLVEWDDSSAYLYTHYYSSTVSVGDFITYTKATSTYTEFNNRDTTWAMETAPLVITTAVSVSTSENDIVVDSNNITGLTLTVGGSSNTTSYVFSGFQLYNSPSDWIFMAGNSVLYTDNITISVNGTQVIWYEPEIMLTDTDLPNRASDGDDGVITWGTNPTGLTITYGSIDEALSVTTNGAGAISATYAYAQGTLDSLGAFTYASVSFEYGTSTSYGRNTSETPMTSTGGFSIQLSPLVYSQIYHFRAVGRHGSYYVYGEDDYFTTLSAVGSSTDLIIRGANVFQSYGDNNSLLFVAETVCNYTDLYPDKKPSQYFSVQILKTNNTDILASTPLVHWGDRPIGIYINPTYASSNFTYGTQYYIKLLANEMDDSPASGNSTSYQLQPLDWQGSDLTNLDSWCRGTAYHMEIADSNYNYTTEVTDIGTVISDEAGAYFTTAIAGISQERPNLFETSTKKPLEDEASVSSAWDSPTNWQTNVGAKIAGDMAILAVPLGVSAKDFLSWIILLFVLLLIVISGDKPLGAMCLCIPIIWVGSYFEIIDIRVIVVPGIIILLLFVRQFFFKSL